MRAIEKIGDYSTDKSAALKMRKCLCHRAIPYPADKIPSSRAINYLSLQKAIAFASTLPLNRHDERILRPLPNDKPMWAQARGANNSNGGDGSLKLAYQSGHTSNDSDARNVSFTYTLWLGTNVTENYTLYMVAARNVSFYHVMQMAADQDPKFKFEASEWPNGHYVHTLAGHKEEPMGYHYWLLYRLPEIPDPVSPPGNQLVAPVGVDDLLVEDGEHYLFWYKKL